MPSASQGNAVRIERIDPESAGVVALLELSDQTMGALYPAESNHLESAAALKLPNVAVFGAYIDGELVACGAVKILEDDGRYGEIKRVFVLAEQRGKGISKAIMAALECHLQASGIALARLETGIKQPEALGLYGSLGYVFREPFGAYRHDPLSVFMEKAIAFGKAQCT
jgi:putative acetyltransferase